MCVNFRDQAIYFIGGLKKSWRLRNERDIYDWEGLKITLHLVTFHKTYFLLFFFIFHLIHSDSVFLWFSIYESFGPSPALPSLENRKKYGSSNVVYHCISYYCTRTRYGHTLDMLGCFGYIKERLYIVHVWTDISNIIMWSNSLDQIMVP